MTELFSTAALHTILLGAVGSAVFWFVLQLVQLLASRLFKLGGEAWMAASQNQKFREYVYRRFTSREGLIPSLEGFQHSVLRALSGLLSALMFCCVALLLGGNSKIVWSICLVSALFYLSSAWAWVTPRGRWKSENLLEHWSRVADLEKELLGNVSAETSAFVAKFQREQQERKENQVQP